MSTREHKASDEFERYAGLLIELEQLMAQGKGDDDCADAIRDRMEPLWYTFSEREIMLARLLSRDLYSHRDRLEQGTGILPTSDLLMRGAFSALEKGDFVRALELIQKAQAGIDSPKVAHFRSLVWGMLGSRSAALFYSNEAARLDPNELHFTRRQVILFSEQGKFEEARTILQAVPEDRRSRSPEIWLAEGEISLLYAESVGSAKGRNALHAAIVAFGKACELADRSLYEIPLRSMCHLHSADCHEKLGNLALAEKEYAAVIRLNPTDSKAFVLRGLLNLERDEDNALRDFSMAIASGTDSPIPYFHQAHRAMLAGDFDACRRLCEEASKRLLPHIEGSVEMEAEIEEMLAISSFELGEPAEMARRHLERACGLAPDNPRILKNMKLLEGAYATGESPRNDQSWKRPSEVEVVEKLRPLWEQPTEAEVVEISKLLSPRLRDDPMEFNLEYAPTGT